MQHRYGAGHLDGHYTATRLGAAVDGVSIAGVAYPTPFQFIRLRPGFVPLSFCDA